MPAESPSPVWFTRCADYGDAPASALDRLLAESGLLAADAVRGKRVLVKPNLLTDRTPDEAVTTHPDVLRPVLRHLKGDKVLVFKKIRRKGYQKMNGHRDYLTQIQINSIN